jgi:hypothetical protein
MICEISGAGRVLVVQGFPESKLSSNSLAMCCMGSSKNRRRQPFANSLHILVNGIIAWRWGLVQHNGVAEKAVAVTAEVAGSSPVVPAIHSK